MQKSILTLKIDSGEIQVPCNTVQTLVIGSGASGLNAAVQLHANGVEDVVIVSEGLKMGTSINTGSDKQTYYKIGMYGEDNDSPISLSKSFFDGGSMRGDLALIEASLSGRSFLNLVNLGVPFPRDKYGQFVGYKTDHDPLQRATSVGPYTSKEMCLALIREVERRGISVVEHRVAVALITENDRAAGAIFVNRKAASKELSFEVYLAENTVFAVGGPGGLYKTSVYPKVHTGAIGLALMEGAKARSLPESQYGMASIKFRWNVSGTYMQVIPKFISTAEDGVSDVKEFLRPYFESTGEMNSNIFLKGYQWPFDPRKVVGGSSIIDIFVYIETVIKKRRVFMDFRENGEGFSFDDLSEEARSYLVKSEALQETPIARLQQMNQPAIDLYADHNIDITEEALEIAVCAQHNNGGLAGNIWWESENIKHLFPIGEVSGSHGVYRPGGSALNAGQVAAFRSAEFIANKYQDDTLDLESAKLAASAKLAELFAWSEDAAESRVSWNDALEELQFRMSETGAHIRDIAQLQKAVAEARKQWNTLSVSGCSYGNISELARAFTVRQLCFAHLVYLESVKYAVESGVGSRGSALVTDSDGVSAHSQLGQEWNFSSEDISYRDQVLESVSDSDGNVSSEWKPRNDIPVPDAWFETAWSAYRNGEIYT